MSGPSNSVPILKWVIRLSILITIGMTCWLWIAPEGLRMLGADLSRIESYGPIEDLPTWQRVGGFLTDAVPAALLVYALWQILLMIKEIEHGRWFEEVSEKACRRAGILMLWGVLAHFLNETVMALILTASREPGQRELVISVSSDQLLGLVPALMALVIAQMLRLARAQRDELNQII